MSKASETLAAAMDLYAAANDLSRAERHRSEARIHMLKAAAHLEEIGDAEGAGRILAEVKRQQEEEQ